MTRLDTLAMVGQAVGAFGLIASPYLSLAIVLPCLPLLVISTRLFWSLES